MNGSRLGLIFSMLFLCVIVPDYQKTMEVMAVNTLQNAYNRAVEQAVEDAVTELEQDERENESVIELKKDEAVKRFFTSLAINMNKMDSKSDRERLYHYVPIVLVMEDGKVFVGSQLWEPIWKEYVIYVPEYLETEEAYEEERKKTITTLLTECFGEMQNKYNQTKYGLDYQETLLATEIKEWCCRTEGVGFAAVFQGYPYGNKYTGYYNFAVFKGAELYN